MTRFFLVVAAIALDNLRVHLTTGPVAHGTPFWVESLCVENRVWSDVARSPGRAGSTPAEGEPHHSTLYALTYCMPPTWRIIPFNSSIARAPLTVETGRLAVRV